MTNTTTTSARYLFDINTNEPIREATADECEASDAAAEIDGGVGAIEVDWVTCYVEA